MFHTELQLENIHCSYLNICHLHSGDICNRLVFCLSSRYLAHVNPGGACMIRVVVVSTAWLLQHSEPDTGLAFKTPAGNHGEGASIIAGSSWCKENAGSWFRGVLSLNTKVQMISFSRIFSFYEAFFTHQLGYSTVCYFQVVLFDSTRFLWKKNVCCVQGHRVNLEDIVPSGTLGETAQ